MTGLIQLSGREAALKRNLRRHLKTLGFSRDKNGLLLPPSQSKDTYRQLHAAQRADKLADHAKFISRSLDNLAGYFANGSEVIPECIDPELELVKGATWQSDLFRLAGLYWRIPVSEGYGRRLRFLVWDRSNGKLIGLLALGDPVFNLAVRDAVIGWSGEDRKERLVKLMDAYVLGALPPYNQLLGGKLVSCLIRTKEVVHAFKDRYAKTTGLISGQRKRPELAMVTTSSALGRSSIYNRLKLGDVQYMSPIGYTSGYGHFHIPDQLFGEMRSYLAAKGDPYASNHGYGQGSNWRLRTIRQALKGLGMNDDLVRHGLKREVFMTSIASNAIDVMRGSSKRCKYEGLLSVQEVSALAVARWMVPRSMRRPEYTMWDREVLVREISTGDFDVASMTGRVDDELCA